MIQCCICEDWYHSDHLKLSDDVPAEYEDMICFECAKHHDFLTKYSKFDVDVTSTGNVDLDWKVHFHHEYETKIIISKIGAKRLMCAVAPGTLGEVQIAWKVYFCCVHAIDLTRSGQTHYVIFYTQS